MKQPVVKGHPLHAIVSDLPVAGFVISYLFDLLSRSWGDAPPSAGHPVVGGVAHVFSASTRQRTSLADAATSTYAAALGGAAGAGILGWWDWLSIPADHPAKRPATFHGLLNTSLLALSGINLLARTREPRWAGTAGLPFALSTIGVLALSVSGWIGGELVYLLGWRVRPAEEYEMLQPGLERAGQGGLAEDARRKVEQAAREAQLMP